MDKLLSKLKSMRQLNGKSMEMLGLRHMILPTGILHLNDWCCQQRKLICKLVKI